MTIDQLRNEVNTILKDIPDREFDGMCILEDMGGISRERAVLHGEDVISESLCGRVIAAAKKRSEGYPLQYILGQWEFFGLPFKVGEGVLIPRPDTEVLVECVLDRLGRMEGKLGIVDLCSGSGCIAIALDKKLGGRAQVYGVELSSDAFPYLSENVRMNGSSVKLLRGDVMNGSIMENFRDGDNPEEYIKIDCIVSNPPYLTKREMEELQTEVRHEPETALFGGDDGLKFYRVITCLWKEILRTGGLLAFEIGDAQAGDVQLLLEEGGFCDIFTEKDAAGCVRVIGGYKI